MAATREQLLADPTGARPLSLDEQPERAHNAELAAHGSRPPHPPAAAAKSRSATRESSMTCAALDGASASPGSSPSPSTRRCEA